MEKTMTANQFLMDFTIEYKGIDFVEDAMEAYANYKARHIIESLTDDLEERAREWLGKVVEVKMIVHDHVGMVTRTSKNPIMDKIESILNEHYPEAKEGIEQKRVLKDYGKRREKNLELTHPQSRG